MTKITLVELQCTHCRHYFKRAIKPGWKEGDHVYVMCKYSNHDVISCGGTVAQVRQILS